MRLWHVISVVAIAAFVLAISRDPAGIVFIVVFTTGLGEIGIGLVSVMALFQTIGALGEAKGFFAHIEAFTATTVVLAIATSAMSAWLFVGFWLIALLF